MRDYPTVPNVFRVASSQNVDTDFPTTASDCDLKIASGTNANLPKGQLREQLQKQKPPTNGNINGQQQSLGKAVISLQTTQVSTTLSQTTATATVRVTHSPTKITLENALPTTTSITTLKTSTSPQQQHQHQQHSKNDFDFIMQNHNSLKKLHNHKLTTHASIEQPHCQPTSPSYLQQSPYATLPRNTASAFSTLSFVTANDTVITDVDTHKHQQPIEHQQQHPNSGNKTGQSNNSNNKSSNSYEPSMLGVINTISGSIPATGYAIDSITATKSNQNGGDESIGQRSNSMGSDLNGGMNNSRLNLSKLNGIQQQQTKQKHAILQQQQSTLQHNDLKQAITMDDFTTYRHQYACSSLERNANGYLWIITPVAASISVAIVIAALAGPQWLFTEEKLPNNLYNGTANFNVLDDGAFITRYTKSSLWIICTTLQGVETYSCIKIDYFSEKGYQPDPHDSASAIPYTVTKSCPFFLASGIVLLLSFIVFLIPTCSHQNNLYYFSAGIMFIVSGLLMLIGLIAYISILKAEIGSKLRPRSTLQPPLFKFTYGQSFFLFVFGFIATEFVGLLNIFLYISLQEVGYYSRLPCFTISNLQEKIKEGENRFNSHTYKSYKHEIESKKPFERKRKQQNKKHQVTAQELELNAKKKNKNMEQGNGNIGGGGNTNRTGRRVVDAVTDANAGAYACRKHPNAMNSTMFLNEMDRRYYFEKVNTRSKCNLHSRNLAKSLNELYSEASSSSALLPPPPPPFATQANGLQLQTQTLPRPPQQFSDSPQEFPLTRSVSTTTDIYTTQNVNQSGILAAKASSGTTNNHRRRNVATNTRYNTDIETQTNSGIGCIGDGALQQRNITSNLKKKLPQQLQQQDERHNSIIYQTNFTTRTCAKNNDLVGDSIDTHNHHLRHAAVNGNNDEQEEDDDDEVDEEQPQKLCGLKRSIRKTKDELFEEFCKRAGVRPKPKNIYYIDNSEVDEHATGADENSTQQSAEIGENIKRNPLRFNYEYKRSEIAGSSLKQQHQQHAGDYHGGRENTRIFDDELESIDMDKHVDENGFKKLPEIEEHLYVIDDNVHLMSQPIRSARRASMYVEPNHLRRLNSNLSLHAIYTPTAGRTGLQKSLYDLDTSESEFGFLTTHQPQQTHYTLRDNTYGGSQQRLHHDYHNPALYQSRTLPRTFLKRNTDSRDSMTTANLNGSATQLHNMYSASQQRLSTLVMQHQHQMQQQNRYLNLSREQELYNSRYGMHKSNEELNRHLMHQQQQPIYIQPHQLQQYQQQQHPNVQCTNYNTTSSALKQPPLVQWPAAIPSSPSNFSGSFRMFGPATNNATQNTGNNHTLLTRSNSSASAITAGGQQVVINGSSTGNQGPPKFQRAYAFDEQRRPSAVLADAFDLDEIERERRRSHASLFTVNSNGVVGTVGSAANTNQEHYDMINGTAV